MKILQINTVISYGSTGKICRAIADTLEENDFACVIAYGRGTDVKGYETFKVSNIIDNYFHYLKSYLFNLHGFGSKRSTKKLINKIEEIDPDIIQLHNIHGYYLNIEMLFNYLNTKQIPIVWLLHDQWIYSGGPASFKWTKKDSISKEDFIGTESEYPKSLKRIFIEKNLQKKRDLILSLENVNIITPSKWLEGLVKKTFLKEFPVQTFYNGIDLDKFYPKDSTYLRKQNKLEDKIVLLAVANEWTESKGLRFLSKLSEDLEENFKLVMVGVDKNLQESLSSDIILIEKTNSIDELAEWYSAADVFINPTLFDNFPTVNIESLACGTPIITYNTGGAEELINKYNGIVVEHGNEDDMLAHIRNVKRKSNKTIAECRKTASYFDKNMQYKKYVKLYKSLLK